MNDTTTTLAIGHRTIPDAEAHTWAKLRQGFPDSALTCLDRLIEHERNQQ